MMLELRTISSGHSADVPVLVGLDLALSEGRTTAVLGRNGAGKSTLVRTIMGVLKPTSGSIWFQGHRIDGLRPERIARLGVGFAPQGRGIFPQLTVEQNLELGAIGKGLGVATASETAFEHFPILGERRRQRAGNLSGGEQQQLAIARALAGNPRLLLLDEPSEGIQPSIVQQIGRVLNSLVAKTGLAVLLVEQKMDLVMAIADRCLFLENGRIEAEYCPRDILDDRGLVGRYLGL